MKDYWLKIKGGKYHSHVVIHNDSIMNNQNRYSQQIIRDRENKLIFVYQQDYINTMLESFSMLGCNSTHTPLVGEPLTKITTPMSDDDQKLMKSIPYRCAIGCLNYLVQCGRADIAVAVSSVAAFCEKPYPIHWLHVKRIFRYLKGTSDYGIVIG